MQTVSESSAVLESDLAFNTDILKSHHDSTPDLMAANDDLDSQNQYEQPILEDSTHNSQDQDVLVQLEARLTEQQKELDEYRRLFDELRVAAEHRIRQDDEEAFLQDVRESYEKDPITAFRMMLDKTQYELWDAIRDHLRNELRRESDQRNMVRQILEDPRNVEVRPYRHEVEYLVSQRGFEPQEAAEFLRNLGQKMEASFRTKSSALQRIRARSSVESGGEPSRASDPDREFYRIIKKAKTLDDMFEGLRRAGSRTTTR